MNVSARLRVLVAISFVLMVGMNALANILPLNGMDTGTVSALFPNLFTPASYTFGIWGAIYLLLLLHVLHTCGLFDGPSYRLDERRRTEVEVLFIISSVANAAWIVAWHYLITPLSTALIIVMLVCLGKISSLLRPSRLTRHEELFVRAPFSLYFGWITVATIANVTVMLADFGFGDVPGAELWTVGIIIVGTLIAGIVTWIHADWVYALPVVWAFAGIAVRHLSPAGYDGAYPAVAICAVACAALVAVLAVVVAMRGARHDGARMRRV